MYALVCMCGINGLDIVGGWGFAACSHVWVGGWVGGQALPGSRESDPVGSDPGDRWQEGAGVMRPGWAAAVAYAVLHVG